MEKLPSPGVDSGGKPHILAQTRSFDPKAPFVEVRDPARRDRFESRGHLCGFAQQEQPNKRPPGALQDFRAGYKFDVNRMVQRSRNEPGSKGSIPIGK